jgi:hypothetical protein
MWDGIENAGWGVHDAASTTWKDLVGARDMVLSNAVFANDAVFRAEYSDGQGFLAYNGGGRFSDNIISFELCANIVFDGWLVPMSVGWSKDYYNGLGIKARALSTYGVFVKGYLGGKTYRIPYPAGNIVGTVSCSDVAYHNGTAMTEDSEVPSPTAPNFDSRGVCVGSNSTYNVKGGIFNVRLYNRLLSPAEVAANYAIDAARFNLT